MKRSIEYVLSDVISERHIRSLRIVYLLLEIEVSLSNLFPVLGLLEHILLRHTLTGFAGSIVIIEEVAESLLESAAA